MSKSNPTFFEALIPGSPAAVDMTLRMLPGAQAHLLRVVGESHPDRPWQMVGENYIICVDAGDAGFVRFACEQQGYCGIVREIPEATW